MGCMESFPAVTTAFLDLAKAPDNVADELLTEIERFIIVMYSRTCPLSNVNDARRYLFSSGTKLLSKIPPTHAALLQHVKRATFQGGHIWGQCLDPAPQYPSPQNWGWQRDIFNSWIPYWSDLPDACKACKELIHCGCNPDLGCRKMCKCRKADLR